MEWARTVEGVEPLLDRHHIAERLAVSVATLDRIRVNDPSFPAPIREEIWDAALDSFERAAIEEHRMTTTQSRAIPPVIKTRTVPMSVDRAFALFTVGMGTWWPLESHSIAADEGGGVGGVTLRFEGKVGGRIVEFAADGSECAWADVMAWQPPPSFRALMAPQS